MINVLFYAEELSIGGVENMMLQWIKFRTSDIHIDLLVRKVKDEAYRQEFVKLGCKVFEANCSVKNIPHKIKFLSQVLDANKYDIVHVHTSLATDFFVLMVAKNKGIKHRIAHSHNVPIFSNKTTRIADKLCKPLLRYYATNYFGCSEDAATALFGKKQPKNTKYIIIKNGIDTKNYMFSFKNRNEFRKEINATRETFIIGSIGRLDYQKDYMFLLSIIEKILPSLKTKKIKVVIAGEGGERKKMLEFARKTDINLCLLGKRNDVNKILSGFDLFVLTSRYEGFPVVMMEAQANGLACIVSEAVPEEALLDNKNYRIPKIEVEKWCQIITNFIEQYSFNENHRIQGSIVVKSFGYDINSCAKEISLLYKKICNN